MFLSSSMESLQIIPYSSELISHFKAINQPWVEKLFTVEAFDHAQFEAPMETIIQPGGMIIFAKLGEKIVGTVALSKISDDKYEMIKMGVIPAAQGKGIGMELGRAILIKAKEMGAKKLVLYSHSKLTSALRIYEKLGFQPEELEEGKYGRCDTKMSLTLGK